MVNNKPIIIENNTVLPNPMMINRLAFCEFSWFSNAGWEWTTNVQFCWAKWMVLVVWNKGFSSEKCVVGKNKAVSWFAISPSYNSNSILDEFGSGKIPCIKSLVLNGM